jgi:hypothetical protein
MVFAQGAGQHWLDARDVGSTLESANPKRCSGDNGDADAVNNGIFYIYNSLLWLIQGLLTFRG